MIEREYIVNLYLIYKELLNEKEKNYFEYYYFEDYSLAEIADLNFFVVRNRFTPDEEIQKSLKSMELSEINISGFVLNDVQLVSENNTPVRSNPHKNKFISGFDV